MEAIDEHVRKCARVRIALASAYPGIVGVVPSSYILRSHFFNNSASTSFGDQGRRLAEPTIVRPEP